ncbi:hypothetical protein EV702DRAFT_1195700 [Suillus placidus]|uniref:Uncharacterized protein n=1 Tax=Suillus placidus TaxID=48579 RepID=A0A9P6ZZE5_9AGAM|nr:hypothetical protein EV702DRAFT_1195700 [Suillus placidus]
MKSSLSQNNNTCGSVEATPTFKTLRLLSGRYLHMLWSGSAATHEDQMNEDDTAAAEAGAAFQRSRSPVSAALATLAKHCPPQLGRKTKKKRQYSSLEQENSPKLAGKRRQPIGWGGPRQEEVLLSWLTHALVPSDVQPSDMPFDVHAQDKKIEDPCDSEAGDPSPKSVSHVLVTQPKTTRRISLASMPEERWSFWITRPLCTTRASETSAQGDLQPATSPPDHSRTAPIPAVRFSSAYASCFANPQRQPSAIHWKLP